MDKYKITLKTNRDKQISYASDLVTFSNDEVDEILNFLKAYLDNFVNVLTQALKAKDKILIHTLVEGLLSGKLVIDKQHIQQVITKNEYEILTLLASSGYTKLIYDCLEMLGGKQINKTLILNLVKIATSDNQQNTVKKLMDCLFPK